MAGSERRNKERLRRVERILENYERDRDRLEERIGQLRREKDRLGGAGFPLLALASAMMGKGGSGASAANMARGLFQSSRGKWSGNLNKWEGELRKLHHKSDEVNQYLNQFQNTLNLMISGMSLLSGNGGGKILESVLSGQTGSEDPEDEVQGNSMPALLEQVTSEPGGDPGAEAPLQSGQSSGLSLENLDIGALMNLARSPEIQALSKELIGKLGKK